MKLTLKQICQIAIMAAITSALSILAIPTPWGVPFTLQTFSVALCGYLLGAYAGTIAVVLYVALGAIGVPVFAGMTGGVSVLVGYSGGYIWGFILMALICGVGMIFIKKKAGVVWAFLFGILGLAVCHLFGVLWFMKVMNMTFWSAALLASVPYLLKDVISVAGALAAGILLKKVLVKAHLME